MMRGRFFSPKFSETLLPHIVNLQIAQLVFQDEDEEAQAS